MLFLCKSLRLQCFNGQADATLLRFTGGNIRDFAQKFSQSLPRYRWLEILRVAKLRCYVELWKKRERLQVSSDQNPDSLLYIYWIILPIYTRCIIAIIRISIDLSIYFSMYTLSSICSFPTSMLLVLNFYDNYHPIVSYRFVSYRLIL